MTAADVFDINRQQTQNHKIEKMIDILIAKGPHTFIKLCEALERTYPSLLTAMFLGNPNSGRFLTLQTKNC